MWGVISDGDGNGIVLNQVPAAARNDPPAAIALVADWTKCNSNKLQDIYIAGFLALSEHEIEAHHDD